MGILPLAPGNTPRREKPWILDETGWSYWGLSEGNRVAPRDFNLLSEQIQGVADQWRECGTSQGTRTVDSVCNSLLSVFWIQVSVNPVELYPLSTYCVEREMESGSPAKTTGVSKAQTSAES